MQGNSWEVKLYTRSYMVHESIDERLSMSGTLLFGLWKKKEENEKREKSCSYRFLGSLANPPDAIL